MSGDDPDAETDDSGLLARFWAWLGSLFGGGAEETTELPAEAAEPSTRTEDRSSTPATHVCTVCGTDVGDPAGGCPLCGSSDVRERGTSEPNRVAGDGPGPTATTSESTVDGEAARLSELRDGPPDGDGTAGETESASGPE
jgi:hypothetical protein